MGSEHSHYGRSDSCGKHVEIHFFLREVEDQIDPDMSISQGGRRMMQT